jgi:GH18 family chitinase
MGLGCLACLCTLVAQGAASSMALSAATRPRSHRRLPEGSLIAGYAVDCDANVMEAVEAGANVVIWFASNLGKNATTGAPVVQMGLNTTCIAEMAKAMRAKKLEVAHLISIGGWNAPHPDTTFTGHEWFAAWDAWNKNHVAHTALGFDGFDGFDWDLEGNDKATSQWNHFTPACIDVVGTMSQHAKQVHLCNTSAPSTYIH